MAVFKLFNGHCIKSLNSSVLYWVLVEVEKTPEASPLSDKVNVTWQQDEPMTGQR